MIDKFAPAYRALMDDFQLGDWLACEALARDYIGEPDFTRRTMMVGRWFFHKQAEEWGLIDQFSDK